MRGDENSFVSRRRWLGQMGVPVAAASVGSLGFSTNAYAAPVGSESAGARVYDVQEFGAKGDGITEAYRF